MKRISQNKFASSLFSCLGVAACVAFSSCGKKDNDQFKNANEFAEFLKSKAKERGVSIDDDQLTEFANANWKTANKKTFKFTEAIKKQIAGEDSDNENEELNPDPEQQNQEQQNPDPEQSNQEQSKPATAEPAATTTISDESKLLSKLIKTEDGKHAGIKVNDICFDLNVFFEIYSWFEIHNGGSSQNLISSKELKLDEAIKMLKKCKKNVRTTFGSDEENLTVDVTCFVDKSVCETWQEGNIYYFATNINNPAVYNNLLYSLVDGTDLGFKDVKLNTDSGRISGKHDNKDVYEAFADLQKS